MAKKNKRTAKKSGKKKESQSHSKSNDEKTPSKKFDIPPEFLEPTREQKKLALYTVILLVVVMGIAGALIELTLKPLIDRTDPKLREQVREISAIDGRYEPNVIQLKANSPVVLIVNSSQAANCTDTLVVPEYDIKLIFTQEITEVRFTPLNRGIVPFSCATTQAQGYFNIS